MTLPDNRIRLPAPRIDFETDVGLAFQDHDNYPPPSGPARFDHMRMMLIGLLAQQASFSEPTQFRDGTPWFDLNSMTLKIRSGNAWVSYTDVIHVVSDAMNLTEWITRTNTIISGFGPDVVFSGSSNADNITTITIPESLRSSITTTSRCFFYKNGALLDLNKCAIIGHPASSITLNGEQLNTNDRFTVLLRTIPDSTFYTTTIHVP